MMKRDLEIAIYFQQLITDNLESDTPIFVPERPIIGIMSEDSSLFTDYFSGQTYINTDIAYATGLPEGFNLSTKISKLKRKIGFKDLGQIYSKIWKEIEDYVYLYAPETGKFAQIRIEDLEEQLGISLDIIKTEDINKLNKAIISGNEEDIEKFKSIVYDVDSYEKGKHEVFEYKLDKPIGEIIDKIKEKIIAQDEPIKKIVTAIYKNLTFDNPSMKSNVLIYGPTGVGKTALVKALSDVFDVPVWIEDMTRYTETGYKGGDVDDILVNLYNNANGDLQRAERSILFLDEIDKKIGADSERSFNKADVLKSLLKIVEGGTFEIETGYYNTITFDTSKLTVIVGGAFTDLYKAREEKKTLMGFGREEIKKEEKPSKEITHADFEKNGMPIEFLGRFKTIIRMNELKLEDFITILKDSELSALKNYVKVFKEKGIDLEIPDELYEKIAKIAESYGTGARSLNIVVDNIFENILFEYFNSQNAVEQIELGENITENKNDYKLVKKAPLQTK